MRSIMSLASDQASLAASGFKVDFSSGHYRLRRPAVDNQMVPNGDLGPVSGSAGMQTAVTAALGIVSAILADESARVALGNKIFGAPLSWQPHTGGYV
jgi:hypothetical protein